MGHILYRAYRYAERGHLQSIVNKDHSNHMSNNSLTSNIHQVTMDLTVLDVESISIKSIDCPWLIVQDGSDIAIAGTVPTYFQPTSDQVLEHVISWKRCQPLQSSHNRWFQI